MRVLGVDACKAGWVGICLDDTGTKAHFAEGVSRQAYALAPKVRQVDGWVRTAGVRVVEAHPELSFAALAGFVLPTRKATWAGAEQRRELLARAGIRIAADIGEAGSQAAVDDVLDAAVVAWTARRVATGDARCRPDPPERHRGRDLVVKAR